MEITPEILLAIAGIGISVVTFLFAYKQTIGARKERAKNAHNDIIKSLYRNLILEENLPNFDMLNRIISSKINQYKIKADDISTEIEFINTIYTKVFEDEFLESKRKENVLKIINNIIDKETKRVVVQEQVTHTRREESYPMIIISIFAILIGMTVVIASYDYSYSYTFGAFFSIVFTFILMTVTILFLQIFIKTRSRSSSVPESMRDRTLEKQRFENQVYKKLKSFNFEVNKYHYFELENGRIAPDFYAIKNDKEYVIEISYFNRIIPIARLKRIGSFAKEIKKFNKKIVFIIITKGKVHVDKEIQSTMKEIDYMIDFKSMDMLKDF